jgi:putative NIF3 family GTP cyclohydrolase 1 type 2
MPTMRYLILFSSALLCLTASAQDVTPRQVVERIKGRVNCEWSKKTVDTFKAGNPDTKITGIATAGFATLDVLKKAAASKCNFIIVHEPTFYNHHDDLTRYGENDATVAAKLKFIKDNNLVVWRFHDHWHRHQPDGIYVGMIEALGWEAYKADKAGHVFALPETTTRKLAQEMKKKLGGRVMRCVGDPDLRVKRVVLAVGAPGSKVQIEAFRRNDIDLLLAGESAEWETTEYVRDTISTGKKKGLIMLGHNNSEEKGMEYCAEWLKAFIKEVPVEFIPSGDPFWAP